MVREIRAESTKRTFIFWATLLSVELVGGCSSGAHSTASRPPDPSPLAAKVPPTDPNPAIYLAQATCWDTVSCCVERHPLTAVESCGADPVRVATILKTLEVLYAAAHPGDKAAAATDVADVEQTEDWSSVADLPEWKQLCIKSYYACKDKGWTGSCYDCLRYCEGQQEWPTSRCGPRKRKNP